VQADPSTIQINSGEIRTEAYERTRTTQANTLLQNEQIYLKSRLMRIATQSREPSLHIEKKMLAIRIVFDRVRRDHN